MRKILFAICSVSLLTCCVKENVNKQHTSEAFIPIQVTIPERKIETKIQWQYPRYLGPANPMDPNQDELLERPINLDCPGVQIIEWRASSGFEKSTGPTEKSVEILNSTCNLVFEHFPDFVRTREKILYEAPQFTWFVCLMPAAPSMGGRGHRNLNDNDGRFYLRPDLEGELFYGAWTAHQRRKIFMTNDIFHEDGTLNDKSVMIFAHELYHALSWHYGIFTNVEEDELMAQDFTKYLNLGE